MEDVFVFDVDGVITHPSKKIITEFGVLDYIIKKLEKGEPVVLNTGRSLEWIIERVVNPLLKKISNKDALNNFFVVAEFGSTWITFDKNRRMKRENGVSIKIPDKLKQEVKNLVSLRYSKSMFYDKSKVTMISVEMKDGYSIDEFRKAQKKLVNDLIKLVDKHDFKEKLKIDATTIATNIMTKHVGKGFAIGRILNWLSEIKFSPQKFITIGDSQSDLPMAEKLHELGFPVEFVFVGNEELDKEKYKFPIITTKEKFEKGTLEFLTNPSLL